MIKRDAGFTLIEIVVAAAIFGVIISIVFPTLVQFLDMRERLQQKHEYVGGLEKAFLFMARDFRYAANRAPKDEYGEPLKTTLSIEDDALVDMTALYPDLNLQGINVPRRLRWVLEEGVLKRIQYPVMDPDTSTRMVTQALLHDVERVDLEVSYVENGRNTKDDNWAERARLPGLIDINIEFLDGTQFRRVFTMVSGDGNDIFGDAVRSVDDPSIVPIDGDAGGREEGDS